MFLGNNFRTVIRLLVSFPSRILIEKDVTKKINEALLEARLGKKCAIICDAHIQKIVGNKTMKALKDFKCDIINHNSVEKDEVKKISKKIEKYDFVIGIGGGKMIDIAKYSSYLAKKPWVAFPTVLSHDGVVSSRAVLNDSGKKISVDAKEPSVIIADLDVIKNAPYRYIAAGVGDLLSNIAAVEDWKIADAAGKEKYNTIIAELSLLSAKSVVEHADEIIKMNEHGLEILTWSLICSGFAMNIYNSSRPCSGSEHNFSHALDAAGSKALHGEQVALGTIISMHLQGKDHKPVRALMKKFKLPVTAKEIGIEKSVLVKALVNAKNTRDRYTILNKKYIDEKEAEKILKKLEII